VDRPSKKDSAVRQPSPLPELDAPVYDELDDRLPGMDPVTAVYFAAQPVLQTLCAVPLQGTLPFPDDLSLVDRPSPKTMAIENLVRLQADLQRLHLYLEAGSTREWLNAATSGSASLAGAMALNSCDLTYLLGRNLYHDVVEPSNFQAAWESLDRGELTPIDGDALRDTWNAVQEQLAKWWKNRDALRRLSFDVTKECERAQKLTEYAGPWSKPDSPQRWAKQYGVSVRTLNRWDEEKKLEIDKLSSKSWRIRVADLPPS
jgi:hypothetical protein